VNDSVRMEVLYCRCYRLNELCSVVLVEVLLGADPVKQLAALAQVGHEVH